MRYLLCLIVPLLFVGCSGKSILSDTQTAYVGERDQYSASDFRQAAVTVMSRLSADTAVAAQVNTKRPKVEIRPLENRANADWTHGLNSLFVDAVTEGLLSSGLFSVTEAAGRDAILAAEVAQYNDALTSLDALPAPKRMTAPEYLITGTLDAIADGAGKTFYTLRVRLISIRTGELIWTASHDIRK